MSWDLSKDCCKTGDILINRVVDLEHVPFPSELIFPDSTPKIINEMKNRLAPEHFSRKSNQLLLSFHSFLVRTDDSLILVDACCGNDKNRPTRQMWHMRNGNYLKNLRQAGVEPKDINYVMCTHLHADHVGWNTQLKNGRWLPTFPNAKYLFSKKELSYWEKKARDNLFDPINYGSYEDSVLPVIKAGQVELVNDEYSLETGINLEPAHGHTPGNFVVHVRSNGFHTIISGDVLHHPIQLAYPKWSINFCIDPLQSQKSRLDFLKKYANTNALILPAHFQFPEYGKIISDGATYQIDRGPK